MIKPILFAAISIILIGAVLAPFCLDDDSEEGNILEVLVISGQSNGSYLAADVNLINEQVPQPKTNTYYYGTESAPIFFGFVANPTYDTTFESYGLHSMTSGGHWKIGGYEPVLAEYISDVTGHDVLIINAGVPSASINYLQPSNLGGEYVQEVISRAMALVDPAYTIHKIGYVWSQGESDANTNAATYIDKFDIVLHWYGSQGFEDCYMIRTRDVNGGYICTVENQIAATHNNVIMASTITDSFSVSNGLMVSDNLHYSQAGRILISEDICEHLRLSNDDDPLKDYKPLLKSLPLILIVATIGGLASFKVLRRVD